MVEIAKELVEAVRRWQIFVAIAQVVLAKLASGVTQRLEQFRDGGVFRVEANRGSRHSDLGQAGADWVLPGDEGGAPRRAALLAIVIGERRAFVRDAVDVRGPVAHLATAVVADVPPADVIAPRIRMFGLSDFAISVSIAWVGRSEQP
jgi:hypothetical protein